MENNILSSLRDSNEKNLYLVSACFGGFILFLLTISCVGIVYALIIFGYIYLFHIIFMSHIRGNGLMVSENQLPHLHAMVVRVSQKLGLEKIPEVYVIQEGGALNAMATKLFGRDFVVIYSDLIDACGSEKEIEMIVGHEIAHLVLGHLSWKRYLALPANLVPFLYQALSRAQEQSCDNIGLYACGDLESARKALLILVSGKNVVSQISIEGYKNQSQYLSNQLSMKIAKLFMYYPYFYERILKLDEVDARIKSTGGQLQSLS